MASAEPTPARVVDLLLDRAPTLGAARLLCVDGPSGSGKTTLAAQAVDEVRRRGRSVATVHMDDLYDGWGGLRGSGAVLHQQVLAPLAEGRPGAYRRYDWHRGAYAEEHPVPVLDVLVVEGVGAWRTGHADLVTVLVWVEAPSVVRLERAVRRDGAHLEPQLLTWRHEEGRLHADEATRDRADLVVDGHSQPSWALGHSSTSSGEPT